MTTETRLSAPEPDRIRAVFSQQDFALIRAAISHYLKELEGPDEVRKYSNLYHRLSRVA
jgi:hypothetical protein